MAGVEARDFTAPDETQILDKTTVELVNLAGGQIGRHTFEPGWRWSECTKPVVGTGSCQVEHIDYVVAGTLLIKYDDSTEGDLARGKRLPDGPGHDASNAVQEPVVFVEFRRDELQRGLKVRAPSAGAAARCAERGGQELSTRLSAEIECGKGSTGWSHDTRSIEATASSCGVPRQKSALPEAWLRPSRPC